MDPTPTPNPAPGRTSSTETTAPAHPTDPRETIASLAPARPLEVVSTSLLNTARMVLRPLRESDRDGFLRTVRRSRAHLDAGMPLHKPGESDAQLFERQLELTNSGEEHANAWRRIGVDASGEIVGGFNLVSISRGLQHEGDANWWVAADRLRLGYALEGTSALIEYAFMDMPQGLGLHRIHAGIRPDNASSIRLAGRLGFRKDPGTSSRLLVGGQWEIHDSYVLSALDNRPDPCSADA